MDSDWSSVIVAALEQSMRDRSGPVTGARFRQAVARVADDRGLVFPPPAMGRFADFLAGFPDQVIISRTPGRDILIVPADRPEILSDQPLSQAKIRPDLFAALTDFSTRRGIAYYIPRSDQVEWFSGEVEAPTGAIKLPQGRREDEVQLRQNFVDEVAAVDTVKHGLSDALDSAPSLGSFTIAIKRFGLGRDWHAFRARNLIEKLKEWATAAGVEWNPSWLGEGAKKEDIPISPAKLKIEFADLFRAFSGTLTESDISRISVPLDVVLKVLGSQHRS